MLYDWEKSSDFPKKSKFDTVMDIVDAPLFKRCLYGVSALTLLMWIFRDVIGG